MESNNNQFIEDLGEISFQDLIERVFNMPEPPEPYSFVISHEQSPHLNQQQFQELLGYFIMTGAKKLFNKQLHELTQSHVNQLKKYLNSIGWDFECQSRPLSREITDYKPDGTAYQRTITVNNWQFMFKKARLPDQLNPKLMRR